MAAAEQWVMEFAVDLALSYGGHELLASYLIADHCKLNLKLNLSREGLGRNKDRNRAGHIRLKFIMWPLGWEGSTRTAEGPCKFCASLLTVFEMF